ncbi:vWA domain-containing protein [Leptospira ryugenii]|nr:VWA domain-containing protein [Leptospira ryugenii]
MIILDASGSMAEKLDGISRMALAKEQLQRFLSKLPYDAEVGLVAYGNRIPGCDSARLYHPIRRGSSFSVMGKLGNLIPAGSTPIASTIDIVGEHLLNEREETQILLISDGIESCDGDPIASLQRIKVRGKKFKLHVLGISLDARSEDEMRSLSLAGNGSYFSIREREDIAIAFQSFEQAKVKIETVVSSPKPSEPKIKIVSILPYSESNSYIVRYEYEGILSHQEYLAKLMVFPREKKSVLNQIPPSDLIQLEVQSLSESKGSGKIVLHLAKSIDSLAQMELWDMHGIPSRMAKSELNLLQNFQP